MGIIRRHPRRVRPLHGPVDVYQCLRCGDTRAASADALTFSSPPPLECRECGAPDMSAGRYYPVGTASTAATERKAADDA